MSCCDRFVMTESSDEFKMWQGLKGPYYIPYVDENGILSWTNNGGLPNPATVNIKGAPGTGLEIKGIVATVTALPATAPSGTVYLVGTEPPYDGYLYAGGGWTYIGVVGVGENGRGIVSINKTSTVGLVDTYTITYTDSVNPTTFTVTNGADGSSGVGVPAGGATGQILAKASGTNFDTEWVAQSEPATATPLMDGTGSAGSSLKYAREDHVHPTDTSRASQSDMTTVQAALDNLCLKATSVVTVSGNGTTTHTLTGLTADHEISNWGMFTDSALTTPIPSNNPICDVTITPGANSWTLLIENFSATFYIRPTFILPQN